MGIEGAFRVEIATRLELIMPFAMPHPVHELFVPGRACLFGEHSDWAGGFRTQRADIPPGRTIVVGTQEGLHATAEKLDEPVLVFTSTSDDKQEAEFRISLSPLSTLLKEAQQGGFFSYIAGTAYRIATAHHVGGIKIVNHTTTLPLSKGLSSSAAVCVLTARAFNQVYDLKLTIRGEMEYAYLGEITTPSKCGRMDQACAFGPIPVVMTYDGDILHVDPAVLKAPLYLVLVDLRAAKDTTAILRSLQSAYPTPSNAAGQALQELLGHVNLRITGQALEYMAQGDVPALGALMREAQEEFDKRAGPMCPEQLTAPVLHKVLSHPALTPLIYGAKGVGSQGDGTAQLLCKDEASQSQACALLQNELGMGAMPLTVLPTM